MRIDSVICIVQIVRCGSRCTIDIFVPFVIALHLGRPACVRGMAEMGCIAVLLRLTAACEMCFTSASHMFESQSFLNVILLCSGAIGA